MRKSRKQAYIAVNRKQLQVVGNIQNWCHERAIIDALVSKHKAEESKAKFSIFFNLVAMTSLKELVGGAVKIVLQIISSHLL